MFKYLARNTFSKIYFTLCFKRVINSSGHCDTVVRVQSFTDDSENRSLGLEISLNDGGGLINEQQ